MKKHTIAMKVALLSAGLCIGNQLKAQITDTTKTTELSEVTVVSTRAAQDGAVSQVTIDRKEIERIYFGQDGAFLLERLSPSIVSYSESGTGLSNYGQMRLRGIDQSRINMTLNGVPLNDMVDQGVFFSNFVDFGNSVQSIQIQRGVGTSTNGVASYAGSIDFESISLLQQKPSAELQFTGGSFGTARTSAEVNTGLLENRTAFYAKYTYLQSDGYKYNTGTRANSIFLSGGYFGNKNVVKFTAFAGRSQNGLAYAAVNDSDIANDPRTNYVSANDVDYFGQYLLQLQHTYKFNSRLALTSTVYNGGAGGDFPAGFIDSSNTSTFFTQINYPLYNNHTGVMSNLRYQFNDNKTVLNTGIHAYTFKRRNIEYIIPLREKPYYEDSSNKNELATFAKLEHKIDDLALFADVQFRLVNLAFTADPDVLSTTPNIPVRQYAFVNPKVGATYQLNRKNQVYLSAGRSGREPTRVDVLGTFSINDFNLPQVEDVNSIQPEFVNDLELGYRFASRKFNLVINGFYMQFENEIAPIGAFVPEGFVQLRLNQQSSYRAGVELVGTYNILKNLAFDAQATYLNAKISAYSPADTNSVYNDVTPILSPELDLMGTLRYAPISELSFSVSGRFLSKSYLELTNNERFTVPQSLIFNTAVNWNFYKQHALSIQVNNITNQLYYTSGAVSADGLQPAYYVQAPAHVYATLFLRF